MHASHALRAMLPAFAISLSLSGCVDVSVDGRADPRDTGLPVYPGAVQAAKNEKHGNGSANVDINTSWFGVKVVAATFNTDAAPQRVVDYYRNEITRAYGSVTECRGEVDFKGSKGSKQPVCREKLSGTDVQLVTGSEEQQRIVDVKPRGNGSEFSLVYVQTRDSN